MRRIIHALLASAILISSLPVSAIAEETSSSQQILDFLQQDSSAAGVEGNVPLHAPAADKVFVSVRRGAQAVIIVGSGNGQIPLLCPFQ